LNILKRLSNFLANRLGPGSFSYGIMKFCKRCVFRSRYETIMILSLTRNCPIVIQNHNNSHYIRRGKCLGYSSCNKCIERIDNKDLDLPCEWIEV